MPSACCARRSRLPGAPPSVRMRLGLALLHQERECAARSRSSSAWSRAEAGEPARAARPRARLCGRGALGARGPRVRAGVLTHAPDHPDALYNLGVAYSESSARPSARAARSSACSRDDPAYVDAREAARVGALCPSGRYVEAHRATARSRCACGRPTSRRMLALANACFQIGALDEARTPPRRRRAKLEPTRAARYSVLALIHNVSRRARPGDRHARGGLRTHRRGTAAGLARAPARIACATGTSGRRHWKRLRSQLGSAVRSREALSGCSARRPRREQQLSYTRALGRRRASGTVRRRARGAEVAATAPSGGCASAIFRSDFQEHARGAPLAEVLELHDREPLRDLRLFVRTRRREPHARAAARGGRAFRRRRLGA